MTADDDRRALLDELAAAGPLDLFALADRVAPPPARLDGRTREGKAWHRRRLDLLRAGWDLSRERLCVVIETPDGEPFLLALAARGRLWLRRPR